MDIEATQVKEGKKNHVLIKVETHKGLIKEGKRKKRNIHKFLTFYVLNGNRGVHKPKYIVFAYGMVYLLIGFLQVNMRVNFTLCFSERRCKFVRASRALSSFRALDRRRLPLIDLRRSV